VFGDNQKILRSTHLPKTTISFRQEDENAIANIADQGGWWIRGSSGQISDNLTRQGRGIVQEGLKGGLGRDEIAQDLIDKLPGMWDKYGFNYARTVAANVVSRARSYSELSSYQQAGITYLEVMAMLDEATTDTCRALDGSVISVDDSMAHQLQAASVRDPKDIENVAPFIREVKVKGDDGKPTGEVDLYVGKTESRFGRVSRSGFGNKDDRGQYKRFLSTDKMVKKGVTMPPYHHQCRTMTVPRTEMVQVPTGYDVNTEPVPSTNDVPLPKKPRKSPPVKQQQRPITSYPSPTHQNPRGAGQRRPIDNVGPARPKPKASQQTPVPASPKTIGQHNDSVQGAISSAGVKDVKVKIQSYDKSTSTIKYTYTGKTTGGKPISGTWYAKATPREGSVISESLKPKAVKKPKVKPPTPKPHPVKPMKRSTVSRAAFKDGNDRTNTWKENNSYSEAQKSVAKRLESDPAWKKFAGKKDALAFVEETSEMWQLTSKDKSRPMHYLQLAVSEEFGLQKKTLTGLNREVVQGVRRTKGFKKRMQMYRAYVRAQYDETQSFLRKKRVKNMHLARGAGVRDVENAPKGSTFTKQKEAALVTTQPASSYTTDVVTAKKYADSKELSVLTKQSVPRERVLGTSATGLGSGFENEYVVIGGADEICDAYTRRAGSAYEGSERIFKKLFGK
jgi:SPP1 gp7 family putative phage head morphogenesis protein